MSLAERIGAQINAHGPMRLDRYIGICLYDPAEGYYATRAVFGVGGDFTTAPEISQIFGEIIGLWALDIWGRMGAPARFTLLELGAGRGVLMRDLLRVARHDPGFAAAVEIAILENSPRRRAEQIASINQLVHHLDHLRDLPPHPIITIANEFFDALPIRQFRNEGGGWLEAYVDADLKRVWRPVARVPVMLARYQAAEGVIELNEAALGLCGQLAAHHARYRGALLAIDYGDWDGTGDTLQAVRAQGYADPFSAPGHNDLTAHVRFADLAAPFQARPIFASQADFLDGFGGAMRRDQLVAQNPDQAETIIAGYARLTAPQAMGNLFKTLAIEEL